MTQTSISCGITWQSGLRSSFICLSIIDLDSQIWLARHHRASVFYLSAASQVPLYFGLVLGHVIGLLATITGVANYSILSAVALALVVILAVFITIAPFNPVKDTSEDDEVLEETEQAGMGKWRSRCMAISQIYGLSARETEVFLLLAKGRGADHIQNKLFISSHTVKTHTYNIYKKLDISSREQLLDLIEKDSDSESLT